MLGFSTRRWCICAFPWDICDALSSTSRTGSLFITRQCAEGGKKRTWIRTNNVRTALAAVLAPLEADEALEGTEEAVLRSAASAEAARLVVLALLRLLRALGRAHRVCEKKHNVSVSRELSDTTAALATPQAKPSAQCCCRVVKLRRLGRSGGGQDGQAAKRRPPRNRRSTRPERTRGSLGKPS